MDCSYKFFLTFFLTISTASMPMMAHPLVSTHTTLAARLRLDNNEESTCWGSLFHLQSCISNVILFFLNGETYLSHSCCNAIRIIGHQCWPSMFNSLGFTVQEGDILLGYCDALTAHSSSPPPEPIFYPNHT